jgi:hypothetical protein
MARPAASFGIAARSSGKAMTRVQAAGAAAGLFAVWMVATYLLEARPRTFLRPDATARVVYTAVANVIIGTIGAALIIRVILRRGEFSHVTPYGVAKPLRIIVLVPAAILAAGLFLVGQKLPTTDAVILAQACAQVLVVSVAEVVVCWALLGAVVRNVFGPGVVSVGIAVVVAALAFGVYHFAHSPPFNTAAMVVLLSGVGVATGTFFFLGGDLYSTIVLHNAFALRGVIQALGESGQLERYAHAQVPLLATAAAAVAVLIAADIALVRPLVRSAPDQ